MWSIIPFSIEHALVSFIFNKTTVLNPIITSSYFLLLCCPLEADISIPTSQPGLSPSLLHQLASLDSEETVLNKLPSDCIFQVQGSHLCPLLDSSTAFQHRWPLPLLWSVLFSWLLWHLTSCFLAVVLSLLSLPSVGVPSLYLYLHSLPKWSHPKRRF